jgi:hypothetical protein
LPDPLKYVPLHWVLFAAWITGALVLLAQRYLPQPFLSEWRLQTDAGEVWHVPIVVITVFCFILWFPARWHAGSKLHEPDSQEDDQKGW